MGAKQLTNKEIGEQIKRRGRKKGDKGKSKRFSLKKYMCKKTVTSVTRVSECMSEGQTSS